MAFFEHHGSSSSVDPQEYFLMGKLMEKLRLQQHQQLSQMQNRDWERERDSREREMGRERDGGRERGEQQFPGGMHGFERGDGTLPIGKKRSIHSL